MTKSKGPTVLDPAQILGISCLDACKGKPETRSIWTECRWEKSDSVKCLFVKYSLRLPRFDSKRGRSNQWKVAERKFGAKISRFGRKFVPIRGSEKRVHENWDSVFRLKLRFSAAAEKFSAEDREAELEIHCFELDRNFSDSGVCLISMIALRFENLFGQG